MKISEIEFFVREAWTGFLRSGIMSVVAVATISISLIVFGMFLLILFNVNSLVDGLSSKLEIVLYLNDVPDTAKLQSLKNKIEAVNGVKEVRFVSKQTAWNKFQQNFQGKVSLEGILNQNPLPDSFIVKVEDISMIAGIAQQFSSFPEINDIRYGGELADRVHKFVQTIKVAGWGIILLLGSATLLIVVNTIRLTVLARQDEIMIMKLVGATNQFVKWPFILEGIMIGTAGAVISSTILRTGYTILITHLQEALPFLPFVYSTGKLNLIYLYVMGVGIFLGFFGAWLSVSKSLKTNA
ncbi:MAG: permease-like cell division protein FtsX [Candidatus Margulisiibacteriota bacterium]|jgi:cell division transport system permease protein